MQNKTFRLFVSSPFSDFKKERFTTIIDHRYTDVINNMIKLLVWYDNEWGYASKTVEILKFFRNKKGQE